MTPATQQNPREPQGLPQRAAAGGNPPSSGQTHLHEAKPCSRGAPVFPDAYGAPRTFFRAVGGSVLFLGLPMSLFTAGQLRNRLLSEALREVRVNYQSGRRLWSAYHQLQGTYAAAVAARVPNLQPMESL